LFIQEWDEKADQVAFLNDVISEISYDGVLTSSFMTDVLCMVPK